MMIFTTLVLFLIYILQVSGAEKEEDVLYFKDIQSEQQREEWDQLPLLSQTRTTSDWCEVTTYRSFSVLSLDITEHFFQRMVEVEEIRELEGRRYIGRFQLADDGVTEEQSVYDTVSGALELRQLR